MYRNYNTDLMEKRTIDKWKGEFIHQIVREMRCLQNQNIRYSFETKSVVLKCKEG